jgi:hypothetical protein
LFFVRKNEELGQLAQEQWYKGFEKSAGKEEKGDLQMASVDITGKAASVKLADGWKIVNKIFVAEKLAA